ncbi:histone PARylation factor 1 isoform X2 [Cylas formicarius]|uniref:histone PARylation factor 1 isoform X2 n=1 Tax=Cylas formicarius TaxID=197179 RepID=UPI0029584379|nr:histone PARylation factor 1 isoform X2 [Cylas formicarius]
MDLEKKQYIKDPRIPCKYGVKCYQKNMVHLSKYKHPPKTNKETPVTQPKKRIKLDREPTEEVNETGIKGDINTLLEKNKEIRPNILIKNTGIDTSIDSPNTSSNIDRISTRTPKNINVRDFIKQKFLVEMPDDFYQFWDFCKGINELHPEEVLKTLSLIFVGPYDVLAGKFNDVNEKLNEDYLIHWRYYFDPPEFQTVLKSDIKTGYHIGYFRDSPEELPIFLASNCANEDGTFTVMGDNIFAAVNFHLENILKTSDPFKKLKLTKFQSMLKQAAEKLNLSLSKNTEKIKRRNNKIVTRSFNKLGIVVPYNRKTQLGYRELSLGNMELHKLLNNIQNALPEQKNKYLSDLQGVITNANIATDECDFGTGIHLALSILAHGVDCLDRSIMLLLATNYRLLKREVFAKIAEAHMSNRKKGTDLSIL